jgi:hypothetical protein
MEAVGLGLKRRIGLLLACIIMISTILAAPAQAALGNRCENRHPNNEDAQERCCKKQADTNREKNRCLNFVENN